MDIIFDHIRNQLINSLTNKDIYYINPNTMYKYQIPMEYKNDKFFITYNEEDLNQQKVVDIIDNLNDDLYNKAKSSADIFLKYKDINLSQIEDPEILKNAIYFNENIIDILNNKDIKTIISIFSLFSDDELFQYNDVIKFICYNILKNNLYVIDLDYLIPSLRITEYVYPDLEYDKYKISNLLYDMGDI